MRFASGRSSCDRPKSQCIGEPASIDEMQRNQRDYIVIGNEYCRKMFGEFQDNWNANMNVFEGLTFEQLYKKGGGGWTWGVYHFTHVTQYNKIMKPSPIKRIKVNGGF